MIYKGCRRYSRQKMKWFAIHFTHGLVGFILILSIIVVGGTNPALAGEDPGDLFNYSFGV